MKEPIKILNSLDDVTIEFFDKDPEGAEDRAGDGYYFNVAGLEGWSGAWQSEDVAMDEAIAAMLWAERRNIVEEAVESGYLCVQNDGSVIDMVNKIDDRWFRILVDFDKNRVRAVETFPSGGVAAVLDTEDEKLLPEPMDGECETGHFQSVVRLAIEAIEERLMPAMTV
jgi:hypothetical protein